MPPREKATHKPFDVPLSKDARQQLGIELSLNVTEALSARSATDLEVQYWHTLYEQGRTRGGKHSPWADAADLTSHIGTEKVDAMRARIVKSIFVEPVWTVEGWGASEAKAPFVEEFHQWQQEVEGFQSACAKAIHLSLIEPRGVLEVYEDHLRRPVRKTIRAKLELSEDGRAIIDAETQEPVLKRKRDGSYEEAEGQDEPSAELEIDSWEVVARGPRHRTIPYRDFIVLPAHATDRADIWGYGKRFYRRVDDLSGRAKSQVYDTEAVEALGTDDEHRSETTLAGVPLSLPPAEDDRAEKELWELLILKDLGKGLRWYVATLHVPTQALLRLQFDEIGRPRYFSLLPFPRPNSTEGYSFIGHKLITVIEEHTAWRNLDADRGAMQLQMPIKVLQGALWDPDTEPIGAKAVITVRDMNEVQPMVMPDTTGTAVERIIAAERAAERLAGITDSASGTINTERRTATELNAVNEASFVRMDEAIRNIQEVLEEVAQVRHLMWQRALAEMGDEGLPAPASVRQALTLRGAALPKSAHANVMGVDVRSPDVLTSDLAFTADMLQGTFRFKPRGSVETADKNKLRQDFNYGLEAMGALSQTNPMIAALMQTPKAAQALVEQWVRLYHVADRQAFLGDEAKHAMTAAGANPQQMAEQVKQLTEQLQQAMQKVQAAEQQAQSGQVEIQKAEISADKDLALQVMKNATTIAVAHIAAAAKGAAIDAHAEEEAQALGFDAEQAEAGRQHEAAMGERSHAQGMETQERAAALEPPDPMGEGAPS